MFRTEHLPLHNLHSPEHAEVTRVAGPGVDPDSTNSCIGSGFLRSITRSLHAKKLRSVAAAGLATLEAIALHLGSRLNFVCVSPRFRFPSESLLRTDCVPSSSFSLDWSLARLGLGVHFTA